MSAFDRNIGPDEASRLSEPLSELLALILATACNHDIRPLGAEEFRRPSADAARPASDHDHFPFQHSHRADPYRSFLAEFTRFCSVDQLAETRALEMAARCVVETSTAAFYRALSELRLEPVLRQIISEISADEVRHYKHFYRFFLRYREREHP